MQVSIGKTKVKFGRFRVSLGKVTIPPALWLVALALVVIVTLLRTV